MRKNRNKVQPYLALRGCLQCYPES